MKHARFNPERFHKAQLPLYLFLFPLALFMALPILFIVFHAFKPLDELFAFPPVFIPGHPTLQNFSDLFGQIDKGGIPFSRYLANSLVVSLSVVVLSVLTGSLAAYALSKKKFGARSLLFEINTLALMFLPIAVTIPRYLVMSQLGILDTVFAHILPLLAMPVGVFLIKQFVDQVPDELIEAARIDGAGDARIFFQVIVPLVAPALSTVAILSFQAAWNNAETSSLFVDGEDLKTLAFYLGTLASSSGTTVAGQGMAAAASLLMFVPNLIVFIVFQGRVMNTMARSGIK
ncbi:MAG: carbohydrate ABC transporter permease [Spirochaetales bacterium]